MFFHVCVCFSVNYGYWDQCLHNKSDRTIIVALGNHCGVKLSIAFLFWVSSGIKHLHWMYVGEDEWAAWRPQPDLRHLHLGEAVGPEDLQKSFPVWMRLIYNPEADQCVLSPSICAREASLGYVGHVPRMALQQWRLWNLRTLDFPSTNKWN